VAADPPASRGGDACAPPLRLPPLRLPPFPPYRFLAGFNCLALDISDIPRIESRDGFVLKRLRYPKTGLPVQMRGAVQFDHPNAKAKMVRKINIAKSGTGLGERGSLLFSMTCPTCRGVGMNTLLHERDAQFVYKAALYDPVYK
jgi:hypothetical protein